MQAYLPVAIAVLLIAGEHRSQALSDDERNLVVGVHNNYRSQLAQGGSGLPDGSQAPSGSNILQMSYDTNIEASAQPYADQCQFQHSGADGYGENIYMTSDNAQDTSDALQSASDLWWGELQQNGGISDSDTSFNGDMNIGHWSQMAWAGTARIGCGVAHCSDMTFVVCQYQDPGNYVGQNIYEIGDSCSQCPNGCAGNGLCN